MSPGDFSRHRRCRLARIKKAFCQKARTKIKRAHNWAARVRSVLRKYSRQRENAPEGREPRGARTILRETWRISGSVDGTLFNSICKVRRDFIGNAKPFWCNLVGARWSHMAAYAPARLSDARTVATVILPASCRGEILKDTGDKHTRMA